MLLVLAGLLATPLEEGEEGESQLLPLEDEYGLVEVRTAAGVGDPPGQGALVLVEDAVEDNHGVPVVVDARVRRPLPGGRLLSRPGLSARLLPGVPARLPGFQHGAGREERVLPFVCLPWHRRHFRRRRQDLGAEEDHLPGVPILPGVVRLPAKRTPATAGHQGC
jgi:hypothetical protein